MGPEKKKPDHNYKVDTEISMSLNIGQQGGHKDSWSIEDLTGIDDQNSLDSMSKDEVEKEIDEGVSDWANNFIDYGWSEE